MKITELYIKNFGKFSEKQFLLQDGVQVITGANESGKSTLHAFIKAMLFGLERGRGKAAAKDDFSRYEPWDNPNLYAGVMRFTCGNRHFRLERSFDRFSKHADLICEDDGEELSVEHGDLEMLLGDMTQASWENTVSIGQFQAKPGQELAESLKNYAANYYETGDGSLDLSGALADLKERRLEVNRSCQAAQEKREAKAQALEQECRYLERDMNQLHTQFQENQTKKKQIQILLKQEKEREESGQQEPEELEYGNQETGTGMIAGGLAGLLIAVIGIAWSFFLNKDSGVEVLLQRSAAFVLFSVVLGVAGVVLLITGFRKKRRENQASETVKVSKENHREEKVAENQETDQEKKEQLHRIHWEQERIRTEWKEKQIRHENLKEQQSEMEPEEQERNLLRRKKALELAEEKLKEAAKSMGQQTTTGVSRRASEIFAAITEGKYSSLEISESLDISVWDGIRRIPAQRLSRGTLEQIYFAMRMAAAELLQEEPMPVILDETFAFYDDKRLKSVLKWLSGQERQVIILSCQQRENKILEEIRSEEIRSFEVTGRKY